MKSKAKKFFFEKKNQKTSFAPLRAVLKQPGNKTIRRTLENPKNRPCPRPPHPVMPAKAGIHDFFPNEIPQINAERTRTKICVNLRNLRIEPPFRVPRPIRQPWAFP